MIRNQIFAVLRKPSVQGKLALISLLSFLNIVSQMKTLTGFASDYGGTLTVIAFVCHIFSYLDFYHMVLWVGFILLLPDIIQEEYLERQYLMLHKTRLQASRSAWIRLIVFSALYVLWFVLMAFLVAAVKIHNFSLEWPYFLESLNRQLSAGNRVDSWVMSLVMLPTGAFAYHPLAVMGLIVFRTFLGFLFLAEVAALVRLLTGKVQYGLLSVVGMIAYEQFVYYSLNGGLFNYWRAGDSIYGDSAVIDLIKTTILPFFTFRSITDDFTKWIRYGILMGGVLVIAAGLGMVCYYRKGDLGDADRDA